MLTHSAPDAKVAGGGRDHESCVGYVRTKTGLVSPQDVRTNNVAFAFCDVAPVRWVQPVRETLFASDAWIKRISIARSYDRAENIPDRVAVQCGRLANLQHFAGMRIRHRAPTIAFGSTRARLRVVKDGRSHSPEVVDSRNPKRTT